MDCTDQLNTACLPIPYDELAFSFTAADKQDPEILTRYLETERQRIDALIEYVCNIGWGRR